MKKIIVLQMLLLFAHFSFAQENSYENLWFQVAQQEEKGLPKSALKIVQTIAVKAKNENNQQQAIKALLYQSKYALILEEDAQLSIIANFKKELANSPSPTKNILENYLANLYWQYFLQNRYKFYNRTKTKEKVDVADFRTWDLETLFNEVDTHFKNSLQNGLLLQNTSVKDYSILLTKQENSEIYRPTLYDILCHSALSFYTTTETTITKPTYAFTIDNTSYLKEAKQFSKLKITAKDSASLQLKALQIYQNLIVFHAKDKSAEALTNVNMERINFVHQHATFLNKEAVLLETLQAEKEQLKNNEVSSWYDYKIALLYQQLGHRYLAKTNEEHRWKLKEAIAICNAVITKFPNYTAAKKCIALKEQIKRETLQLQAEKCIPTQLNSRILVTYKNCNTLNFTAYKIKPKQLEQLNQTYPLEKKKKLIQQLEVFTHWENTLRNENDYQNHTTEVIVPKLENGQYIIVAENKNSSTTFFAYTSLQATNIALIQSDENQINTLQLINRNTGKPIVNATLKVTFKSYYNSKSFQKTYTSSNEGFITIPKKANENYRYAIEVITSKEKAYFDNFYLNQKYEQQQHNKDTYAGFLFTDRSIYRPGQTVYFKGIAIQNTSSKKTTVLPETKVSITLRDANHQEVKTLYFTTNEYGSFQGEFILPPNGLTGNYNLNISGKKVYLDGNANISVEEYKRPKFKTTFKPITETYKVNDSISLKGEALAYAGSAISNAKVVYRVRRKVNYPKWYYWYRPYFNSENQEIAHGETSTNAKGIFSINFKAIPDLTAAKENRPIFNYEVTADITDSNGETRSATTIVNVGYHALQATINSAEKITKEEKNHSITLTTKNLNGALVAAKGVLKIYKAQSPKNVVRPRPWAAPDYQDIAPSNFENLFPHDIYLEEKNTDSFKKEHLVFEKKCNTATTTEIKLNDISNWKSGAYIIVLECTDKFGQLVKEQVKTQVFSLKDTTAPDQQLFTYTTSKENYKPGETATITVASAAKNMFVNLEVVKKDTKIKRYSFNLTTSKKTIEIPITTNDIGGFSVHYSYAAFNYFKSGTVNIIVPYPKSELEIETLSFRDKIKPGVEETWSFKIKGPKSEKVTAEILASMYDASLDQFKTHNWSFNPLYQPNYFSNNSKNASESFGITTFRTHSNYGANYRVKTQAFDQLNWFGLRFGTGYYYKNRVMAMEMAAAPSDDIAGKVAGANVLEDSINEELDEVVVTGYNTSEKKKEKEKKSINLEDVIIRKNLQETAFFFPQLQTDSKGNVSFSFTTPEALTKWKLQLLAHTKDLKSVTKTLETVTQKELMVIPNAPRFLREGDQITIRTKIANLSNKKLSGIATLQLFNATTGKTIDTIINSNKEVSFTVDAQGNTTASWKLSIPNTLQAVQYKIIAKAGSYSDGEQNMLPVLSNRMLVTETLPMWIRSNQNKTFTLNKLKKNSSTTLKNHQLTLEITSNPAWYAVQALPYLMEYPYQCNEQTFARYYANALASHIANSNPKIQEVFNQWKNSDALVSNLEKNEELKSLLLEETPWLRDAESETEQKKRIALLFDANKMKNELENSLQKLQQNQITNGAWSWFKGGRENRYITQHIVAGFGHLKQLNVKSNTTIKKMLDKAIRYLDSKFIEEYEDLKKHKNIDLTKDHLSYSQLHYLYLRSFFPEIKKSNRVNEISNYYLGQIKKYWLSRNLYAKAMMALILHREQDATTAKMVLKSLEENSITSEELGMYWKENTASWYWYQAPIETQALLIEAFSEIQNNTKTIDNLKIWLLKNKQTNKWETTKATTEAVYALLVQGSDWLSVTNAVNVTIGGKPIPNSKLENSATEAGTGYFKTSWKATEITPKMAEVSLKKVGNGIAWGALYWQYFEDLDKITSAVTPLQLHKKLFLKNNTNRGEELTEITKNTLLKVGNLVRVRIELRCDRDMEFVHLKDMRAAGLEPINVLSQYKWQDGLGYYQSTKDAATNFFFDYLPKGIYVFEYDLRVNNAGVMSNGISTIQSMYAPEFSSHSEGIKIRVE